MPNVNTTFYNPSSILSTRDIAYTVTGEKKINLTNNDPVALWKNKYVYSQKALYELRAEFNLGLFTQAEVRAMLNKALKANGLPSLPMNRQVCKNDFVKKTINHFWEVLNVQEPRTMSKLQRVGQGQEEE